MAAIEQRARRGDEHVCASDRMNSPPANHDRSSGSSRYFVEMQTRACTLTAPGHR
jgi:hypothetical protein